MKTPKIGIISIFVFCIVYFSLMFFACTHSQKGEKYYLPENYAGWVCVSFNVDGQPPLPLEDGYLVVKIPSDGRLETSSGPRFSPKISEYYYYNENGVRIAKELQHGGGGTIQKEGEKIITFHFWVSSGNLESDYNVYVKNKDAAAIECGPWRK